MARFFSIISVFALLVATSLASPADIEKRDFTGKATWTYEGLGACGIVSKDTELVTGVSAAYFNSFPGYKGGNPNKNPICGRYITAKYKGKTVKVKVTDHSTGGGKYDLNLSKTAFAKLANPNEGVISHVTWVQN